MSDITEEQLNIALADQVEFSRVIKNMDDVNEIILNFPAYADHVFTLIYADVTHLKRLLTCPEDFTQLIKLAHTHTHLEALDDIQYHFKTPEFAQKSEAVQASYKQFAQQRELAIKAGQALPDHITPIVTLLTTDVELFQTFTTDTDELLAFIREFPQYITTILDRIADNPDHYKNFVKRYLESAQVTISACIPAQLVYFNAFHARVSADERAFQGCITTLKTLMHYLDITELLSDPEVFQRKFAPLLSDEDFNEDLNEEPEEIRKPFSNFIAHRENLIKANLPFPNYTNAIISLITSSTKIFNQLIATNYQLRMLAHEFPKIRFFQSRNITKTENEIREYTNARDVASTLMQGRRDTSSFFARLDEPCFNQIVLDTVDQTVTTPAALQAVIEKACIKPVIRNAAH